MINAIASRQRMPSPAKVAGHLKTRVGLCWREIQQVAVRAREPRIANAGTADAIAAEAAIPLSRARAAAMRVARTLSGTGK